MTLDYLFACLEQADQCLAFFFLVSILPTGFLLECPPLFLRAFLPTLIRNTIQANYTHRDQDFLSELQELGIVVFDTLVDADQVSAFSWTGPSSTRSPLSGLNHDKLLHSIAS